MHLSRTMHCATGLLIAALVSGGSVAWAAEADVKPTTPHVEATATKNDVVVRVNGVDIGELELNRARKAMLAGLRGATLTAEQQNEFDKQAIQQLVAGELLYQAGQKLEIKDLDKQVDAKLAQGKARYTSEQDFAKAIKEAGLDEKQLQVYTRRIIIIANFVDKTFVPKATVTEEDAKKFYDQNPDKFTRKEALRASHILIGADEKATADEKKKAREKAEKLRKELAGGADFAKLARENSTCPSNKQGGDLGYFGKGDMAPTFEQAAFALKPGELSDVVETRYGFHVIKLVEKKAPETAPFKDIRVKLTELLREQKVNAAIGEYLAVASKSARIEVIKK